MSCTADMSFSARIFTKSGAIGHQIKIRPIVKKYYATVLVILNVNYLTLSQRRKDC